MSSQARSQHSAAGIPLEQVVRYLDVYLRVREIPDDARALNGLQVEGASPITRVLGAVDASLATIEAAATRGASLVLVHHGLFWGGLEPLVGRVARRVRTLVRKDISLYAAHLPLDCHPEVGNNAVLARHLGLTALEPFGRDHGIDIGLAGELRVPVQDLARKLEERLGGAPRVIPTGPPVTQRVAVVTGAGSFLLREAHEKGIDTFVTGEGPHHSFFDAEEWGINVLYAGHYATETVGVEALGAHIQERFGVPFEFFDHPTGL
jgi:dinuclear metal center YbgI/SA1388 family protein